MLRAEKPNPEASGNDKQRLEWAAVVAALTCAQLRDVQVTMAEEMVKWIQVLESPRCRYRETSDVQCRITSGWLIEARPQADEVDRELERRKCPR